MKTLILLALVGFVLALSLAIPFNGDADEILNEVQAKETEGDEKFQDKDEEDDDENTYDVGQGDDDDEDAENGLEGGSESALTNPEKESSDPIWPIAIRLIGRRVFRRFRRRRSSRRGWRRRSRRGGWRRGRRRRRWG